MGVYYQIRKLNKNTVSLRAHPKNVKAAEAERKQ